MRYVLSAILLTLSMANAAFAGPIIHARFKDETPATEAKKPEPDPKKVNEAAAIVTAVKHCLSMDGSLNQQPRLIDAFNIQPDLEHLPNNLSDNDREKTQLYTQGRPDIPDFGFLISNVWRVTNRDQRIKFDAIVSLKLMEALGFKSGAYAFAANCKPVMQGNITESGNFQYARVDMPLAFSEKDVTLTYVLAKQNGYNWQIDDLLIDNVGITNYIQKDLVSAVNLKGIAAVTKQLCQSSKSKSLRCN